MQIAIRSVADLGLAVRAARRVGGVRLDDLAATSGVSKQFAADVEYGKSTVQLGLVLKLLAELGTPLSLSIPDTATAELVALRAQGGVLSPRQRLEKMTNPNPNPNLNPRLNSSGSAGLR